MSSRVDQTLARILGVNREGMSGADRRNNQLAREYFRRAALWARELGCEDAWPYLDIAARIQPSVEIDAEVKRIAVAHTTSTGKVAPTTGELLMGALAWATLLDRPELSLPSLPDPYAPILALYENGGDIVGHHGMISTPVFGFRIHEFSHYSTCPPFVDEQSLDVAEPSHDRGKGSPEGIA